MGRIKEFYIELSENSDDLKIWFGYGIIALFLIIIFLLFLNTTPYYDLFAGDQHGYYLQGVYLAGRDYLQNDWVSTNYRSYHIAFTLLVYALDTYGILEPSIGFIDIGIRIIFLTSVWLIIYVLWNSYFANVESSQFTKRIYPLVVFFIFTFSINPINPLSKIYESLNLEELSEFWNIIGDLGGFANQWLFGFRVSPASFAVFILLGLSLLLIHRWKFATICFGIASLFHVSYIFHSALIVLVLIIYFIRKKENRIARQVLIIFTLMVLPLVIYLLTGLITDSTSETNAILSETTAGTAPKTFWRNADSIHLVIIILAGILLWIKGKGEIFPWIFNINVLYAVIGIGLAWLTSNSTIGLLLPWRAGAYLYPISILVLFMTVLYYTTNLLDKIYPILKYGIPLMSLVLLMMGLNRYGLFTPKKDLRYERSDHKNYHFYIEVRKNTEPADVILIPVDDGAFRMDAERAVYVDNRNLPGWGTVLVEWYERIGYASAFYDLDGNERQIACRDAGVDYYALYGIEPDDIEPVLVKWKDKSLIACPITDSDN